MATTHKIKQLSVVTIASAGTAVQVTSQDISTPAAYVQADSLNTGKVYVGDADVDSTNGIELAAGESVTLDGTAFLRGDATKFILSDIWVDTATNGNKVRVSYLVER